LSILGTLVRSTMARQSAWSLAVRVLATVGGFLFALVSARLLGSEGYGVVAVTLSVAVIASTIATLGSNGLAVREVARCFATGSWSMLKRFLRWSGFVVMASSISLGVALLLIAPWSGPYKSALPYAAALILPLAAMLLLRGIIQGSSKPIAAQVPGDVVRWTVALAVIGGLFAIDRFSPNEILVAYGAGCMVALGVSIAIASRIVSGLPEDDRPGATQDAWIQKSLPFLGITAIGIVGTEINTLLLGVMAGPREAGLYQPIAKIAPLMLLVREAVEMPLAPRIVHDWEAGDKFCLQGRLKRAALGSVVVTAILVTGIIAAGPFILGAFGPEFVPNAELLLWIGVAQVINAALGAAPLVLSMVGGMKERLLAQVITLIVQAGSAIVLVPIWGARGAVFSLVAAILTWSIANWALAVRATGLDSSAVAGIISPLRKKP
jgi:O-antigen/teichoic acid export membrane protein